jgi:hypothetical protein
MSNFISVATQRSRAALQRTLSADSVKDAALRIH